MELWDNSKRRCFYLDFTGTQNAVGSQTLRSTFDLYVNID